MRPISEPARRWGPWLALAVGVAAIAVLAGTPARDGPPLDPSSTAPAGTRALVDTLRELGADVVVQPGPPGPSATTALLLVDGLDGGGREAVDGWVEAGGTLVVTDVSSALQPARPSRRSGFALPDAELRRDCEIPALRQVGAVRAPGAVLSEVPPGATGCFRRGGDAWLVVVPRGRGTVVGLGGAGALVNSSLGDADNALLAVSLLAPTRSDRVVVLRPPSPGSGRRGLVELVAPEVKLAILQLGVAFVVLALWRARRLGRPVTEAQPVRVPGSELVMATGALMQRARARGQAAALLRGDLGRDLGWRLGLPPGAAPEVIAGAVAAARRGREAAAVLEVLAGGPPVGEDELVALARSVETLRRLLSRG